MLQLAYYEVPVAHSMVGLAHRIAEQALDPIQEYLCYWSAFNNIYTVVAERVGRYPEINKNPDGSPRYINRGTIQVVSVNRVQERDRLNAAFDEFSDDLKHYLIVHPNTEFFVNRKPIWRGTTIEIDRLGQRVNGIINMDYTIHPDYPVWSGIDITLYNNYLQSPNDDTARTELSRQILDMLYTIRNNLAHGAKRFDDATDNEVLTRSVLLLQAIVTAFLL